MIEVNTLSFEERLKRLRNVGTLSIKLEGVTAFDYASFPRFASLIAVSGEVVRPRMRAFSWLMKLVEDAYDARFAHEKMDVERDDEDEQEQIDLEQHTSSFPVFVVRQVEYIVDMLFHCFDVMDALMMSLDARIYFYVHSCRPW